ncbi:MATE family efflux transporter [Wolinella succinogenes]|uniref:MATE family efflux transporter n=1 Tax=Wolinella succinogenes TaxID=844 RepID=UPI002FCB3A87
MAIGYREYLSVALPFVVSTLTQPLLGAVDTAVVGRLGDASYIGGVAIGTVIFNTLYWLFGFLRVGTSGFSAQSLGAGVAKEQYFAYFRPASVALLIGLVFLVLQKPILSGAFWIYQPKEAVITSAQTYFEILIWGAPLVLLGYVNLGWIMGQRLIKETLWLQISTNLINIALDVIFVFVFEWGVAGVAYATLIAQSYAFALGLWLIGQRIPLKDLLVYGEELWDRESLRRLMSVNLDLMIRTICLLTMTNIFVAQGSRFGTEVLAANAILFQIQYLFSYFFDGVANASSVFAGRALGAKNVKDYDEVVKISNQAIGVLSLFLAFLILVGGELMIAFFTELSDVREIASAHKLWLAIFPFVGGIGLVYYGIFTGATFTRPVRNSMIGALACFGVAYSLAVPLWGNHGLWLAFIVFSFCRSLFLYGAHRELRMRCLR